MNNVLNNKTVLVIGGAGSIGSEIVKQALNEDASKVLVFSRDEIKHFIMRKRFSDERLETIVGDIRDIRSLERLFYKYNIDVLFHAAAMKHVVMCEDFPIESVQTNILGTQNIVDLSLKYQIPKMITISTDKAAYPANVMGACKFIAERITLNANKLSRGTQSFSCVRFGNVANSRGSVIPIYIENLLNNKPIQVTDLEVTRFIMEIPDAVNLVLKATSCQKGGEIFILKMKSFRLGDLLDIILDRIAPKLNISKQSVKINMTGLVPGEKLHEVLISDIEASNVYELNDMYVFIPSNNTTYGVYPLEKIKLSSYSSNNTELMSKGELEEIVRKYLKTIFLISQDKN